MAISGGSGGDPKWYFLLRKGLVNEAQYDAARARGGDVVERLLEEGLIEERHASEFRAMRLGMAFADLDRVEVDQIALDAVPSELARELRALPVKLDGRTLWVAFAKPDIPATRRIAEATGLRVIPVLCTLDALDDALARL